MIKIPKIQLSSYYKHFIASFGKSPFRALALRIMLFLFLYFLVPAYLVRSPRSLHPAYLILFYLVNIAAAAVLFRRHFLAKNNLLLEVQDFREKVNIFNAQNALDFKNQFSLKEKIERYAELKKIIEEINRTFSPDSIAETLCSICFTSIAAGKGTCTLFLVDGQMHTLSLFKTKKHDRGLVIKTKQGDIFDFWVMRHASPLFIEDIRKDFRFDIERLSKQEVRPVSSLISAPFVIENRFLGLLRLDSPEPQAFTQDDLRFLVTMCDLGAVALEDSELYQKTLDLATHDALTSLYTKGYFLNRLNEECARAIRKGTAFSLLMLDIDFFKNYNDNFGHTAGDIVLKSLSSQMLEPLEKQNAIICRFGGEEFCVLLLGIDKPKAQAIAQEIRSSIEKAKVVLRRQETNVTVSIGVAAFPKDAATAEELILKADQALYQAKGAGRNKVVLC